MKTPNDPPQQKQLPVNNIQTSQITLALPA